MGGGGGEGVCRRQFTSMASLGLGTDNLTTTRSGCGPSTSGVSEAGLRRGGRVHLHLLLSLENKVGRCSN